MLFLTFYNIKYIKECFIKKLDKYNIKRKDIGNGNEIIIIEDSLILLVSIYKSISTVPLNAYDLYKYREHSEFLEIPQTYKNYYELGIEELTYNEIGFKYNHSAFVRELEKTLNEQHLGLDIHYTKFRGFSRLYWCPEDESTVEMINRLYPDLLLKERYDTWEGIKYYFIIMSVKDKNEIEKYAVAYTTRKPHSFILEQAKYWIKHGFSNTEMMQIRDDRQRFIDAFNSYNGVSRQKRIEEYFKYFYIEKYFKEKDDLWKFADKLLKDAYNSKFINEEFSTYKRPVNKWKSEELVYNLTKKLYKDYEVIYQHKPFFLRSNKGGQMSYDVYISKLRIAIEYQGKQHFEPVDFFGGEKSYIEVTERDKLKKELSEQNGVKLIYINYWEDINSQLIREKIEEVSI